MVFYACVLGSSRGSFLPFVSGGWRSSARLLPTLSTCVSMPSSAHCEADRRRCAQQEYFKGEDLEIGRCKLAQGGGFHSNLDGGSTALARHPRSPTSVWFVPQLWINHAAFKHVGKSPFPQRMDRQLEVDDEDEDYGKAHDLHTSAKVQNAIPLYAWWTHVIFRVLFNCE